MSQVFLNTRVIKLGGSSQTKEGYDTLFNQLLNNKKTVIVVSAIKEVTNNLIKSNKESLEYVKEVNLKLSQELLLNNSFLEEDFQDLCLKLDSNKNTIQDKINLVSIGETFTARILNEYLISKGLQSIFIDSTEFINCNLLNTELFNKGEFTVDKEYIFNVFKTKDIVVVPGFRGKNIKNEISLMGRGGSDTTGSIISSALESEEYQIWTDVNGIYSGDPNKLFKTNLINSISYDAAQEISAMGAKVIHPYCIRPCKLHNIPIIIKNTYDINSQGTIIEKNDSSKNSIYAITNQSNISVFKIESLNMWNNYGFVYDIFSKFKDYNVDVNIINTSQFDITTTTDDLDKDKLEKLKKALEEKYNVNLIHDYDCVSIVGDNIKKYKKINQIMNTIKNFDIKLTSYSSNDMTLSFIIDKQISIDLSNKIHNIIFPYYKFKNEKNIWWEELLNIKGPEECKYLYNLDIVQKKINNLKNLSSIDRIYYAMKANNYPAILNTIIDSNFGIETVSIEEINCLIDLTKNSATKLNILFTPNFSNIKDYEKAFEYDKIFDKIDIITIVDNLSIINDNVDIFKNKEIGIRLDLDYGFGHCNKVITQGQDSKFGITFDDLTNNLQLLTDNNITITGFHSHMGSGITDYKHWINNLKLIIRNIEMTPNILNNLQWIDIGGGFGIDNTIDFEKLNNEIHEIKSVFNLNLKNNIKIFIEPGRYLVAESGIIWGSVNQIKYKNKTKFIGTNIGMTDLIRPALYSAIHPVFFKDSKDKELVTIVGPICESGDVLIRNLEVNKNISVGDSIIVTNTGAYGYVMASNYNNRKLPVQEILK